MRHKQAKVVQDPGCDGQKQAKVVQVFKPLSLAVPGQKHTSFHSLTAAASGSSSTSGGMLASLAIGWFPPSPCKQIFCTQNYCSNLILKVRTQVLQ